MAEETKEAPQSKLRAPSQAPEANRSAVVNPASEPQRRVMESTRPEGPFVQFVGEATKRLIKSNHWRGKFTEDQLKDPSANHEWNRENNYCIPVSEFSDHQLDYLLVEDMQSRGGHSFLEVDYDDNGNLVQVHTLQK